MDRPNFVFMLLDNLGYGDVGCYGNPVNRTPHIDRMAADGMRLTSFYSTSGVCTPSRASLMTGCYPRRVGLHESGEGHCVLMPCARRGLHPDEVTVARLLREAGYATGCVGKWHLGDQAPFLPTRHGFDEFFGVPYSEDMVPNERHPDRPPLPLMRGETVIEAPVDREFLTRRYTEEAIRFIRDHRDEPFFLYVPHAMPGSSDWPFPHPDFAGRTGRDAYADCVEELDWSVGEILRTLGELGLDERTLFVWTSDNGAVRHSPVQGTNAPLRGWGYDTSEGGQRMPCIARWPGQVPAGVVRDDVLTMMDFLPTFAALAGTEPPRDRTVDGHDIRPILFDAPDAAGPCDETGFFYYYMGQLQAVRAGPWKLYLALERKLARLNGRYEDARPCPAELYDVRGDIGETREVSAGHADIVARLTAMAEEARRDLGDEDRPGLGQRPAGWVERPRPQLLV